MGMSFISRLFKSSSTSRKQAHPVDLLTFTQLVSSELVQRGVNASVHPSEPSIVGLGREVLMNNLYDAYLLEPGHATVTKVAKQLECLLHELQQDPIQSMSQEEFLDSLIPIVRPKNYPGAGREFQRINEELSVYLALATKNATLFVASKLAQRNLNEEEAFARSIENLRARTRADFSKLDGLNVFIGDWNDEYDSSRILLKEMFAHFPMIRRVRVAIPSKSRLIFWDAEDKLAHEAAMRFVEEFFTSDPGPLFNSYLDL